MLSFFRSVVLLPAQARYRALGRLTAVLVVCSFSFFVNAAAPDISQLPARWRHRVRLAVVDSFYPESEGKGGRWFLAVPQPR
ncbi:hypothetical protein [Hymenobacter algoricola]|uniref:Uncharacterized protein n=1 Tax=Hymenobacter algoricola TaxID=486267 RepID=A0ABP7MAP4_9BACT